MKYILAAIAVPVLMYALTAFVTWGGDLSTLESYDRFFIAFLTGLFEAVVVVWYLTDKERKQ